MHQLSFVSRECSQWWVNRSQDGQAPNLRCFARVFVCVYVCVEVDTDSRCMGVIFGATERTCRDIINSNSPAFTQSCLLLRDGPLERQARHDRFPAAAINFRLLSAAVLLQVHLSAFRPSRVLI